jgi:hypothetical protein
MKMSSYLLTGIVHAETPEGEARTKVNDQERWRSSQLAQFSRKSDYNETTRPVWCHLRPTGNNLRK